MIYGREKELEKVNKLLSDKVPFIFLIGQRGSGKTSFLDEVGNRLSENESILVVKYKPFFLESLSMPYLEIINSLLHSMVTHESKKIQKRSIRAIKSAIARLDARKNPQYQAYLLKLLKKLDRQVAEELQKLLGRQLNDHNAEQVQTLPAIDRQNLSEFFNWFEDFLVFIADELEDVAIYFLIDEIQQLRGPSIENILYSERLTLKKIHFIFGLESGGDRGERMRHAIYSQYLHEGIIIDLGPLDRESINRWVQKEKRAALNNEQLDLILEVTGGLPALIHSWMSSEKEGLGEMDPEKIKNYTYLSEQVGNLPAEIRRFLRQLSILDFPLEISDYAKLTRFSEQEVAGFLVELEKMGLFFRYDQKPWFATKDYKQVVYQGVLSNLLRKYHQNVIKLFEEKYGHQLQEFNDENTQILLSYSNHLFKAMEYRKAFQYNTRLGDFFLEQKSYLLAFETLQRATEAGKLVGYDDEAMILQANLGYIYFQKQDYEEAGKIFKELSEFFARRQDRHNLSIALYHLANTSYRLGKYEDAKKSIQGFLDSADEDDKLNYGVKAYILLGDIHVRLGELDEAEKVYEKILPVAEEDTTDPVSAGLIYHSLGNIRARRSQYEAAQELYLQAISIFERNKIFQEKALSLSNLSSVFISQDRINDAIKKLFEAEAEIKKCKQRTNLAFIYSQIGIAYSMLNDNDKAYEYLNLAQRYAENLHLQKILAKVFFYKGLIEQSRNNLDEALTTLENAYRLAEKEGISEQNKHTAIRLGRLYIHKGEYERAISMFESALREFEKEQDIKNMAALNRYIGDSYLRLGLRDKARKAYDKCLAQLERLQDDQDILAKVTAQIKIQLGEIGEDIDILEIYRDILKQARVHNDKLGEAKILNNIAVINQRRGKLGEAEDYYIQALEVAQQQRIHIMVRVLINLGFLKVAQGELDRAEEYYTELQKALAQFTSPALQADSMLLYGIIKYYKGAIRESIEHLKYTLRLYNNLKAEERAKLTMKWLGMAYQAAQEFDEAASCMTEVLRDNGQLTAKDRATLYFRLGTIRMEQGEYSKANESLMSAMEEVQQVEDKALMVRILAQTAINELRARHYQEAISNFLAASRLDNQENLGMEELINTYLDNILDEIGLELFTRYSRAAKQS